MITISIAPPLPSWTGHDRPPRAATPPTPSHTPLTAAREAVNFRSIYFDAVRTAP